MTMPPMAIIGAITIILRIMIVTCCTWVMSFVVLVIRDAVPKVSNSWREKLSTWEKSFARTSRPNPAPDLEAK